MQRRMDAIKEAKQKMLCHFYGFQRSSFIREFFQGSGGILEVGPISVQFTELGS